MYVPLFRIPLRHVLVDSLLFCSLHLLCNVLSLLFSPLIFWWPAHENLLFCLQLTGYGVQGQRPSPYICSWLV
jgi:hypothetical protein